MTDDVVTGAAEAGLVDFELTTVEHGRTTWWQVTCVCGDKGTASNRVTASRAAAMHAMSAHGGARARLRVARST